MCSHRSKVKTMCVFVFQKEVHKNMLNKCIYGYRNLLFMEVCLYYQRNIYFQCELCGVKGLLVNSTVFTVSKCDLNSHFMLDCDLTIEELRRVMF